jgi:putative endonuclease
MRDHPYAVYIMTSRQRRVLYAGQGGRFSRRYALDTLVWYEWFNNVLAAIAREKQLKAGSRPRKIGLIEAMNPEWRDLSGDL